MAVSDIGSDRCSTAADASTGIVAEVSEIIKFREKAVRMEVLYLTMHVPIVL